MKLSNRTVVVLKNFATINSGIYIKAGKQLSTISHMKTILGVAEVEDEFPKDFAIFDLNKFLAVYSLFDSPELNFQDKYVQIISGTRSLDYHYADPSNVISPKKILKTPETDVKFDIKSEDFKSMIKAASVLDYKDFVIVGDGKKVGLVAKNLKTGEVGSFKLNVETATDKVFETYLRAENLKFIDGNYTVSVHKQVVYFQNKDVPLSYWIGPEANSNFE